MGKKNRNNFDIGAGLGASARGSWDNMRGNSTLDIRNGTVTELNQVDDDRSFAHSDDMQHLTARRATFKILEKFDKLINDTKYQFKKKPKFDFNDSKVAR